jgi:hypothetical protein
MWPVESLVVAASAFADNERIPNDESASVRWPALVEAPRIEGPGNNSNEIPATAGGNHSAPWATYGEVELTYGAGAAMSTLPRREAHNRPLSGKARATSAAASGWRPHASIRARTIEMLSDPPPAMPLPEAGCTSAPPPSARPSTSRCGRWTRASSVRRSRAAACRPAQGPPIPAMVSSDFANGTHQLMRQAGLRRLSPR